MALGSDGELERRKTFSYPVQAQLESLNKMVFALCVIIQENVKLESGYQGTLGLKEIQKLKTMARNNLTELEKDK